MKVNNLQRFKISQNLARTTFFFVFFFASCEKFIEIPPPQNQIISTLVFTDDKTATTTVLGLYSRMMQSNLAIDNGALSVYSALSADELYNTTPSTNYDPFFTNNIPANQSDLQGSFWPNSYNYIYQANACIDGLNQSNKISLSVKSQLLGELKFIRALNYFCLVNLFGDVPLELSTDYTVNEGLPRTASADVYKQIVSDLIDAQSLLIPAYPTSGAIRANRWAATALLARVYLYQKDWINAEASSTSVINSGAYSLVTNLNNVFLSGSTEAILQLVPNNTANSAEGFTFIPSSTTVIPPFAISNTLLNAFELSDQRKSAWLGKNTVNSVNYYYPFKYKIKTNTVKTEYNMVLRLPEQYLIRSEARAQQNKITGTNSAESDLDIVRTRAGLTGTTANTQSTMLLAIEKERQTEFFTEWGHRWLDLKRTGRIDAVLSVNKTSWKSSAAFYPIPYLEIQLNPFLTQNPGY